MSYGKYSVNGYKKWPDGYEFKYNCYGKLPDTWTKEMFDAGDVFDAKTMCDGFDEEGYDRYGYSSFDLEGTYVGDGNGVDRTGVTEIEYLQSYIEELAYVQELEND